MKHLLVIGYVWPEPNSSAAGSRMMQLLHFFMKGGYQITFATGATRSLYAEKLEDLGITTAKIKVNDASFDDLLREIQPEIVLFDRFMMEEQFGWRVSEVCPEALKILDTEDLHFLRKVREISFKKGIAEQDLLFTSEATKREIASIYRCDLSLIISEAEMELLKNQFKVDPQLLLYLPFLLEEISGEESRGLPRFQERQHFISIGNFYHEPNWNAVLTLKEQVWPLIRKKLPNAEVHVYGAYASEKVFNLHNPHTGFLVKGRAENAEKLMQSARVCLAPIQFGAGLKGKFLQAMQCGTPGVTTTIGAEGISGKIEWPGAIENDPAAFADAAVNLYENEDAWKKAQSNGFNIINTRFSKSIFEKVFYNRIFELSGKIVEHRKSNFIGAMLQHHQHKSTYFMSKYIELKNKGKE
ncbi:glycosyl transferase [Salinimicrobium marinum]|uniref:Glycosyl transferase n=1 Tax=Salinimicrobium marinum TaxID=680283 RepID=A0A918SA96_9FLAO|nr:glycosyltransferase [Salinimicrobium marinum]GHA31186.1 glycosyl transferase [Salinimicrobium marinum]